MNIFYEKGKIWFQGIPKDHFEVLLKALNQEPVFYSTGEKLTVRLVSLDFPTFEILFVEEANRKTARL